MKLNLRLALGALGAIALFAACTTSKAPVPPDPSTFTVFSSGADIGISAPAGSADPGTAVNITAGGVGSWAANADGSVSFKATASAGTLTLSYTKSGQGVISNATVQTLSSLVQTPLFSTGAAPNDMLRLDGDLLLVANALDNTVTSYTLDGVLQQTASFPEFASPSYLVRQFDTLAFAVRNGDNIVSGLPLPTLEPDTDLDYPVSSTAAFAGLGKAASNGRYIFVPQANILTFGPTTYGPGLLTILDTATTLSSTVEMRGHNTVYALVQPRKDEQSLLYVVSAGELHFDVDFNPSITTDSFIQEFTIEDDGSLTENWFMSLGPVGASVMSIRPQSMTHAPRGYIGSLLAGKIYMVDLLHGTGPEVITLTNEFTYVGDIEYHEELDRLLATSFNTDELYVVEPLDGIVSPAPYPGPFDLSLDPQLLAGTSTVEVDAEGNAYVLYSVANSVAKVELLP